MLAVVEWELTPAVLEQHTHTNEAANRHVCMLPLDSGMFKCCSIGANAPSLLHAMLLPVVALISVSCCQVCCLISCLLICRDHSAHQWTTSHRNIRTRCTCMIRSTTACTLLCMSSLLDLQACFVDAVEWGFQAICRHQLRWLLQ